MNTGNKLIIGALAVLGVLQFLHILGSADPTGRVATSKFFSGIIYIAVAVAGYYWAKRNPPGFK